MNTTETDIFKKQLLAEKAELEGELSSIGEKNSSAVNGWEASTRDMEVDKADENEVADKLEEYEGNSNIVSKLDSQLKEVNAALDRVTKGTYGICETCGKPIEKDRLEANPSARVSIKHSHE